MRQLIHRKTLALAVLGLGALAMLGLELSDRLPSAGAASARIEIWHGHEQKVGHLGWAQPDFNLMGSVQQPEDLLSLQYTLNEEIPVELNFRGYRRLVRNGHFNADIPIASLKPGHNRIELEGLFADGVTARQVVTVTRLSGASPLPLRIDWTTVADPQDVGQYVDGHWLLGEHGLRTGHMGYDRLFLIGNTTWQDYEVTAELTVHEVASETGPLSGGNGLGVIMRFAGHVEGGHRRFPVAQPKWGYQPFGAIAWLRWQRGAPTKPAALEFMRGDSTKVAEYGTVEIRAGERYFLKALCQTLPNEAEGRGVTRYAFKFWPATAEEPPSWDWEHVQVSRHALRRGGVALVAHHVDASFGNITVVPVPPETPQS